MVSSDENYKLGALVQLISGIDDSTDVGYHPKSGWVTVCSIHVVKAQFVGFKKTQLNDWFGDVYAEVTDSFGKLFTHIIYSKGGNKRWEALEFKEKVRCVIKKKDIGKNMKNISVLHTQYEYRGGFGRYKYWGRPIEHGKYKSNYPEVLEN